MQQLLLSQYESIKGARQALFTYCITIDNADLFKPVAAFNDSCMIDLLVHNTNTYIHWLKNFGMDGTEPFHETTDIKNIKDVEILYKEIDLFVNDFLEEYSSNYEELLIKKNPRREVIVTVTPLQLFTHVITHEFHHKGQILTMSRLLDYIPADTDVIRT
jgi:uncharacterized damage-inducible protein DinB